MSGSKTSEHQEVESSNKKQWAEIQKTPLSCGAFLVVSQGTWWKLHHLNSWNCAEWGTGHLFDLWREQTCMGKDSRKVDTVSLSSANF